MVSYTYDSWDKIIPIKDADGKGHFFPNIFGSGIMGNQIESEKIYMSIVKYLDKIDNELFNNHSLVAFIVLINIGHGTLELGYDIPLRI